MSTAVQQALELMLSGDPVLLQIIGVTLRMSITSSLVALLLGAPFGVLLAVARFPFKQAVVVLNRTMMGLPPVVCGLVCYLAFCGVGPLRGFHLLYTVEGMIIAQIILITPIVAGNVEAFARTIAVPVRETARGLGLSGSRTLALMVSECRYQLCSAYLLGFGRAIAEVGAVSMVGGAIAYKTNVMTTAIMQYTNMGDFTLGIALGIILLLIALVLNVGVYLLQTEISR